MEKTELLLTKLMNYRESDFYPMHMPGHKRNLSHSCLNGFPNPFSIDITEIDGFDNLHHAEEILKASMEWAASVYGADKTYYLVNGSSGGILSAVSAAVSNGGRILISRNCHKSVYHGVILKQLQVDYIYPQIMEDLGIQGGILPEDVERSLQKYPNTEAVLVVSPTYDGVVSDIRAIAQVVHKRGIPLIVDEAHGAHFPFGGQDFPVSALEQGADVVIQSLHKTLPSLTQTAVLHVKGTLISLEKLEYYLQIYQTSSPSYVFLAAIEQCIFEMEQHGRSYLHELKKRLDMIRFELRNLKSLRILQEEKGRFGVFALDSAKLVISCRGCRILETAQCFDAENLAEQTQGQEVLENGGQKLNGSLLAEILRNRYHIEMEMSSVNYVTAITTCFDSEDGLKRLCRALLEIDEGLERDNMECAQEMAWERPEIQMKMSDAAEAACELLPLEQCAGKISAEFIYLYPPGIPIAAPGEIVTEAILKTVMEYKMMGFSVQGMADRKAESLRVIR